MWIQCPFFYGTSLQQVTTVSLQQSDLLFWSEVLKKRKHCKTYYILLHVLCWNFTSFHNTKHKFVLLLLSWTFIHWHGQKDITIQYTFFTDKQIPQTYNSYHCFFLALLVYLKQITYPCKTFASYGMDILCKWFFDFRRIFPVQNLGCIALDATIENKLSYRHSL